jgi:deoxyribonuclease V
VKIPSAPHSWTLTPKNAIAVQRRLAPGIVQRPLRKTRFVAGVDCAFSRDGEYCLAAAILWDTEAEVVVEEHLARRKLRFPYVPGLLTFREGPAVLAVLRKLKRRPDVLMFDGQGLAHPRRFGIASHIGLIVGIASLGCAKSRLTGQHGAVGDKRGDVALLEDGDEVIGLVLRTRDHVRPVFVSVGHLCDLDSARALTLRCVTRYRLPEPTRLADRRVAAYKQEMTR